MKTEDILTIIDKATPVVAAAAEALTAAVGSPLAVVAVNAAATALTGVRQVVQAAIEGRDLTDAELAAIVKALDAKDAAWKVEFDRLKAEADAASAAGNTVAAASPGATLV